MNLQKLKVLVFEDNIFKANDIKKALNYCRIQDITQIGNQADGLVFLHESLKQETPVSLIVTDMQYPINRGEADDPDAGEKLLERLKEEKLTIPAILCSSLNYKDPAFLGCIWYNKLRDLNQDFKTVLAKME